MREVPAHRGPDIPPQQGEGFTLPVLIGAAPVHAGDQQIAEGPNLVAQGDQLVAHGGGGAKDDAGHHGGFNGHIRIRHVGPGLERDELARTREHLADVVEVKAHGALRMRQTALRLGVARRHQHHAHHAPVLAGDLAARTRKTLAVTRPMGGDARRRQERTRERPPAPLASQHRRAGMGRGDRHMHRRAFGRRGLGHDAHLQLGMNVLGDAELPEFAIELIGRALLPDRLHHGEGFQHHAPARGLILQLEQLPVRRQAAGADAKAKTPLGHPVKLSDLRADHGGVAVRQADHAGPEGEISRLRQQARHEHQRRGNGLAGGGKMLAQPELVEPDGVQQQRLAGHLVHHIAHGPSMGGQGHEKNSEIHGVLHGDDFCLHQRRMAPMASPGE